MRRLREAGAIVVGKTNTPELGLRPVTENARFGATRNPWNPRLSAGGSSGGSAAAVASGMVALADGSDLGGSIRIPASCCGVVGLKPSLGRVSIGPDFGDIGGGMPVDGALTRTVLDTAVALDAIAGYEPGDRHGCPRRAAVVRARRPARSPATARRAPRARRAPLGVPVDDEPRSRPRVAAELLAELGHDVRERVARLGRRGVPVELGDVPDGLRAAPRARRRAPARPAASIPRPLEPATRAWLIDAPRRPAGRLPRGGRAAVGVRPPHPRARGATTRFWSRRRSRACPPRSAASAPRPA